MRQSRSAKQLVEISSFIGIACLLCAATLLLVQWINSMIGMYWKILLLHK